MDDKNFEKLLLSVKEANEIINKKRKPSRSFIFETLIQKRLEQI